MGNVNMEASQINYRNNSKPSAHTVDDALNRLFTSDDAEKQDIIDLTAAMTAKADKIDIAPTFSAENTYFAGDLVFQSGRLWKFTTNHTPGEWNQEEVIATNIDLALKAVDVSLPDYSETEQPTGQKWIDGKDIFIKTLRVQNQTFANKKIEIDVADLNIDKCFIDYNGSCFYDSTNQNWNAFPWVPADASVTYALYAYTDIMPSMQREKIVIASANDFGSRLTDIFVTIRYTKNET